MSTASAGARREFFPWYGHHAWKFFIAWCAVGGLPLFLTPVWVSVGVLPLLLLTWYAMHRHDRSLCERCLADWPLDPEKAVAKHQSSLAQFHVVADRIFTTRRQMWIITLVLLTIGIGSAFLPQFLSDAWGMLINWLVIPWLFLISYRHRQLQPWCPWCKDDDGGSFSPDPVPDPSVKADR